MKKIVALAAVLGAVMSFGTTMAFAGGETGADAAHTQPYWPQENNASGYVEQGPGWDAPALHSRYQHNAHVRDSRTQY